MEYQPVVEELPLKEEEGNRVCSPVYKGRPGLASVPSVTGRWAYGMCTDSSRYGVTEGDSVSDGVASACWFSCCGGPCTGGLGAAAREGAPQC